MLPFGVMETLRDGVKPGVEVGGYRVDDLVGWGSVASVYRVTRLADQSVWAMKVLEPSGALEARFEREGRIQQVLDHPNLVRVHEILVIDGLHTLIMDFIDGPSLGKWIEQNRPSYEQAISLIYDIAIGVKEIHDAGLIHRDLTPGNVLLHTDKKGNLVPKVTDFGLAKRLNTFTGGTLAGTVLGTPAYAAPEQLRDASSVDQRVDTYALGAILYELIVGKGPFEGLDAYELRLAQRDGTWKPAGTVVDDVPAELDDLMDQLIVYDAGARLGDINEVIELIGHLRPQPAPMEIPSWAWMAMVAMPVVALAAGAVVALL